MENALFKNPIIKQILDYYATLWALDHLNSLAGWDLRTYMPKEGVVDRGEAFAKISTLSQKIFLDNKFVSLIKKAENEPDLNSYEKGIIRILKRSLEKYEKLPPEFLEEFDKVTTEANNVWEKAKIENNFSLFEPYLEKIVNLCIKKAEYLGYKGHPYDALLDEYEEGLTTKEVEEFFSSIKEPLKKILSYIKNSSRYKTEHPLSLEKYDKKEMENVNLKTLEFLNYDPKKLRLDVSAHPFTTNISLNDHRITTWYRENDFARSLFATIHEYGHALYESQFDSKINYTPLCNFSGLSLSIHESQSRFWENMIGRTKQFIHGMHKSILGINPNLVKYNVEEIYNYFNLVKPSLIRVEADEVSYHFHVMIRFEIEKGLMEGKIKVKDLPKIWNEKYKEYLGIEPKTDREGVLQDVHWSSGSIGYFPTYSIGTFLSGLIKYEIEKDIGDLGNLIKSEDGIKKIQDWLKEKIHQYGGTYTMKELVKKSFGKDFSPSYFLSYLEKKYKEVY